MHQQINRETCQLDPNTRTEPVNTEKQEQIIQTQPLCNSNQNITYPNTEQTLTQEEKINVVTIKRMMSGWKTTLPSLRNQDWKKSKNEKNKRIILA